MKNDLSTLFVNGAAVEAFNKEESNALLLFVEQKTAEKKAQPKDPWSLAMTFDSASAASLFFEFVLTKTIVCDLDNIRLEGEIIVVDFESYEVGKCYEKELDQLLELAIEGNKAKQASDSFYSEWLTCSDYKPFGVMASELCRSKENPREKILESVERHDDRKNQDEMKLKAISDYTIEKWKSEMLYLLDSNWDVNKEPKDSERLISAVVSAFKEHVKSPFASNILVNYELISKFCEGAQIYAGQSISPETPSFVRMTLRMNWMSLEDKMKTLEARGHDIDESSRSFWAALVKIVSKSVSDLHYLVPKGYDAAVKAWKNDEQIVSPTVEFNDSLIRGTDDILYSPAAALKLSNIVYSDKEQGVKPFRSIIGFLVRDLMECLGLIFVKKQRDHLIDVSRSLESLQAINIETFWETSTDDILSRSLDQLFNQK